MQERLIYSDRLTFYSNGQSIDLLNSFQNNLDEDKAVADYKVFQIKLQSVKDKEDIYLATAIGLFKNFRRIFSKGSVRQMIITDDYIFIATDTGIYKSKQAKKDEPFSYEWTLIDKSPIDVIAFLLDEHKKHPAFAASSFGFFAYDPHKKQWQNKSTGLRRDFSDSFGFRRLLRLHTEKGSRILLTSSSGIYLNQEQEPGLWFNFSRGLKADPDGFYTLRDICLHKEQLYLATSTGLYFSDLDSLQWQKNSIVAAQKNDNLSEEYYALLVDEEDLYVGDAFGNIYKLLQAQTIARQEARVELNLRELINLEPSIQAVQKKALAFAAIPTGKKFDAYKRQARLRNFIPNLEAFWDKDDTDLLQIDTSGRDDLDYSTGALTTEFNEDRRSLNDLQMNSGIRFSWDLANLIYDPEVLDINNSARIMANIRENLLTELTQIYFARKELMFDLLSKKAEKLTLKESLKLEEYTAQIDARTGAWFSEEIKNIGGQYEKYVSAHFSDGAIATISKKDS